MRRSKFILLGSVFALSQAPLFESAKANYQGLFVIINPYDTVKCNAGGDGPDWIYGAPCPPRTNGNYVYDLLKSHNYVNGIFLHLDWASYRVDKAAGFPALLPVLQAIANIGTVSSPVNLTVGMSAGANTPCDVLQQVGVAGIWVTQSAGPPPVYACTPLPKVYSTNGFSRLYYTDLSDLVTNIAAYFAPNGTAPGVAFVTGLKVSGLNTNNIEIHVAGDQNRYSSQNLSCTTSQGVQLPYSCSNTVTAEQAWLNAGYYPAGVEARWNEIVGYEWSIAETLPSHPLLEIDSLGSDNFTAIVGQQSPLSFDCVAAPNTPACVENDKRQSGYGDGLVGLLFFENVLLADTFTGNYAPSSFSVQLDGLKVDQPAAATPNAIPVPCWAYYEDWSGVPEPGGPPVIGFQSATGLQFGTQQNADDYYNGLLRGPAPAGFGAQYLELWPIELNQYIAWGATLNPSQVQTYENNIASLQAQLITNAPSANNLCNYRKNQ